jgi:hypothetical protein
VRPQKSDLTTLASILISEIILHYASTIFRVKNEFYYYKFPSVWNLFFVFAAANGILEHIKKRSDPDPDSYRDRDRDRSFIKTNK